MINPRSVTDSAAKLRFYLRLGIFAVILLVVFVKPKFDEWRASRNEQQDADDSAAVSLEDDSDDPFRDIARERPGERYDSRQEDPQYGGTPADRDADEQLLADLIREAGLAPDSGSAAPGRSSESRSSEGGISFDDGPLSDLVGGTGGSTSRFRSSTPTQTTPDRTGAADGAATAQGSGSRGTREKSTPPDEQPDDAEPPLGKLRLVGNNRFRSTAGLLYLPGSADRHRLIHVLKHSKDNLSKPVHGVFDGDGDRNVILRWIDEAWKKAQESGNRDVRHEREGGRDVYTVRMNRRIGYLGGEVGQRKDHPECRMLRIVVQNDNEVVTAYPVDRY